VALMLAVPVAAQQMMPEQADSQAKTQARMFETVLHSAIEHAGERLASRVNDVVPGVQVVFETEPIIRTVPTPEGPVFDVQIPRILGTGLRLMKMLQPAPQPIAAPPATGAQPVSTQPPRVTATSVPPDDPMVNKPNTAGFNPDQEYSNYAREALVDAMLDNSGGLPLTGQERLEVTAGGLDVPDGSLNVDNSRRLVLVISAADLSLFHAGKITRDQAKQRIREWRY
jgi:hypothetical protein